MITPGTRVRLNDKTAKMAMRGYSHLRRGNHVDWTKREGTVITVSKKGRPATIIWDGNKTYDYWPIHTLEEVTT